MTLEHMKLDDLGRAKRVIVGRDTTTIVGGAVDKATIDGRCTEIRRQIAAVDPGVPASFVRSMDQWMAGTLAPRRFNLQLVAAFAAAAQRFAVARFAR